MHDGWEPWILWNVLYNAEHAITSSEKVSEYLAVNEIATADESFSVMYHYFNSSYKNIQELLYFFADALDSNKSWAIFFQKYILEEDQPYAADLYYTTKQKFSYLH